MILSDRDIISRLDSHHLTIEGVKTAAIQPASVDLHLSNEAVLVINPGEVIDPRQDNTGIYRPLRRDSNGGVYVPSHTICLASVREKVRIPPDLVGVLEGKSSLARLGLMIHATAGFIDPGFDGWITLEILNCTPAKFYLYPGMPIGQISLHVLSSTAHRLYAGKYQHQGRAPEPSRYHMNVADD